MQCTNHPTAEAHDRCTECRQPFCPRCLVEIEGQQFCGQCKMLAVKDRPLVEEATVPCKVAGEALTYAIVGIFCFGIILEPIAIAKALKAQRMIREDPRLTGSGKATAALIIAIVALVLWVLGLFVRLAALDGRQGLP
jgi:hypothetical protein